MSLKIELPPDMCNQGPDRKLSPSVMRDPHDLSGHTEVSNSSDDDDFHLPSETLHPEKFARKDSIAVQQLRGPNDCEEHEKNPHLEDFLIPKRTVLMQRLDEDGDDVVSKAALTEEFDVAPTEESDTYSESGQPPAVSQTSRRSCLRPETESYYDRPKTAKSKRNIHFGEVLVRDYGMILGDNPCVSYGPPVTIDWDYVEYGALPVDEYEFHRPPRRGLREMGMNYYQRKNLLTLAGYTEDEFKAVKKQVKKQQSQRYVTRSLVTSAIPFPQLEATLESAVRKCRRLIKDDHWKSERGLFVR